MRLTERQQNMVSVFLKQSGEIVRRLSPEAQAQAITQVKTRLKNDLNGMGDRVLQDEEVAAVLERCRVTPTGWQHPARLRPAPASTPGSPAPSRVDESSSGGVDPVTHRPPPRTVAQPDGWLHVCRSLSTRWGYDVRIVRAAFLAFGFLTGPVALITYLGLFFEQYFGSRGKRSVRIDEDRVLRTAAKAVLVTAALYGSAYGLLRTAEWSYLRFFSNDWSIGGWGWLPRYQHIQFFCVLVTLTPVAVLSAMPLPNQWDRTLERCVRAGWVLYAALLCAGIAAALAGSILGILRDFVT